MGSLGTLLLICSGFGAAFGLILIFRRNAFVVPEKEPERTQEYLVKKVGEVFHEILTTNVAALYLDEEETRKKERLKEELRRALRTCSYGDIRAKEYVKEHIRDILLENCGIREDTIDDYFHFSGMSMSGQDRFDILLYLYKKQWQYDALAQLLKHLIPGEFDGEESLGVTRADLDKLYEDMEPALSFGDKVSVLVQRIYQIFKGNGVIDEIRDMNIDGVSAGVSGISDICYDVRILTDPEKAKDLPKSYESIWVFFRGKTIHLSFLGFGSGNELERVCKNIYRYDNPGQLSAAKGYIANEMQDGSRVIVVRPPFCESWAFFVRKFNSADSLRIDQLITGAGSGAMIGIMKGLITGCQVIGITGEQGCGKTTLLKALIGFVNPAYTLRIQELIFELNLRKLYPDRNILTFRETASVSGQEGLDVQKKTDGTVTILGEVATAPVASWLVQVSQTASRFTMFTHHAKTTKALIASLRNSLLLAGGFSNEQVAEEQAADAVNFDIHMQKDMHGHRYIERITEIVGKRGADGRCFSAVDIAIRQDGRYRIVNSPSEKALRELSSYMTEQEKRDFERIFLESEVELCEAGQSGFL